MLPLAVRNWKTYLFLKTTCVSTIGGACGWRIDNYAAAGNWKRPWQSSPSVTAETLIRREKSPVTRVSLWNRQKKSAKTVHPGPTGWVGLKYLFKIRRTTSLSNFIWNVFSENDRVIGLVFRGKTIGFLGLNDSWMATHNTYTSPHEHCTGSVRNGGTPVANPKELPQTNTHLTQGLLTPSSENA